MREVIRQARYGVNILDHIVDDRRPRHMLSEYLIRLYLETMETKSIEDLKELAIKVDTNRDSFDGLFTASGKRMYYIDVIGGFESKKILSLDKIMTIFKKTCLNYPLEKLTIMNSILSNSHNKINEYINDTIKLLSKNGIETSTPLSETARLLSINPNDNVLILEVYSAITENLRISEDFSLGGIDYLTDILPCYSKSMDILITGILSKDKAEQEYLYSAYKSAINLCAENTSSYRGSVNMDTKNMVEVILYIQNTLTDISKLIPVAAQYTRNVIDSMQRFYNSEIAKYGDGEGIVDKVEFMREVNRKLISFEPLIPHANLFLNLYIMIRNVHHLMLTLLRDTSLIRLKRSM